MAKVTKTIAAQVAEKITAKLKEKIKDVEKEMQVAVTEMMINRVPKEVMEVFKKYPNYMHIRKSVSLNSSGYQYRGVTLTQEIPVLNGNSYINEMTKKEVAPLDKIEQRKSVLEDKYRRTYQEIESTLIGLGTYKRVQKQFPELYKYLPSAPGNMSLMLVPEKIRETVSCLVSDDAKCIDKL